MGHEVAAGFRITGDDLQSIVNGALSQIAVKGNYPGSVQVNKTGVAAGESFFQTGIADIQLSATGISDTTGVDMIIVLDMSGSMSYPVSAEDATMRLDALKNSMKSLMLTLQKSNGSYAKNYFGIV